MIVRKFNNIEKSSPTPRKSDTTTKNTNYIFVPSERMRNHMNSCEIMKSMTNFENLGFFF